VGDGLAGSAAVASLQDVKGISFPGDIRCGQILVTGPPGAGKSTLIMRLGGWSEEGYLDLGRKHWWRSEILSVRPREIHLGMPFVGLEGAAAVFDVEFIECDPFPPVDFGRLLLPPRKRYFFSVDWYRRYVFEFLLPPADLLFARRRVRAEQSTHPVDSRISLEICAAQLDVFRRVAEFLHAKGFYVYHRETIDCAPQRFLTPQSMP
jgi:energy-coupling factor transporter ATP-binding protein EcfA2